jgi:hypothetical protein
VRAGGEVVDEQAHAVCRCVARDLHHGTGVLKHGRVPSAPRTGWPPAPERTRPPAGGAPRGAPRVSACPTSRGRTEGMATDGTRVERSSAHATPLHGTYVALATTRDVVGSGACGPPLDGASYATPSPMAWPARAAAIAGSRHHQWRPAPAPSWRIQYWQVCGSIRVATPDKCRAAGTGQGPLSLCRSCIIGSEGR